MSVGPGSYAASIFDTITGVPHGDWSGDRLAAFAPHQAAPGPHDVAHELAHDLAMDRRLLETFERTMRSQCQTWSLVVRDAAGRPMGQAAVCRFLVDGLETTGPLARAVTRQARKIFPRFVRLGVLFCGLPVPGGQHHLRIAPGADPYAVVAAVDEALGRLARQTASRLIVWREFDAAAAEALDLPRRGYLRGDIPCGHVLSVPPGQTFTGFADYAAALRATYRRQLRASLKKREDCEFLTLYGTAAAAAFTDDLHLLYCQVRDRAQYRMETLTPEFFRGMFECFGEQASLTLMRQAGRAVGFVFGLTSGQTYHNLYVGLDYEANAACDAYFNLYYRDMDQAFRRGCRRLDLGQTSDAFKSRLGSVPRPLFFFVRAAGPVSHWALRCVARWAFPPVPRVEPHQVFRTDIPTEHPARHERAPRP